jgi:hypothetical protein
MLRSVRKQISAYCPNCRKQTLHARECISNVLHLILSIITAGLWIPVWIFLGIKSVSSRTRCQVCGTKHAFVSAPSGAPRSTARPRRTVLERGASRTRPASEAVAGSSGRARGSRQPGSPVVRLALWAKSRGPAGTGDARQRAARVPGAERRFRRRTQAVRPDLQAGQAVLLVP